MQSKPNSVRRAVGALSLLGAATTAALATWGMAPTNGGPNASGKGKAAATTKALVFRDLRGKTYGAQEIAAHKASVFLFLSVQCPVSNTYTPRFLSLAADYGKRGVPVYGVYANWQESLSDVTKHAKERGFTFPVIRDTQHALADRLGATATPQAIVVDSTGAVRYRGRIDDNAVPTKVTSHDLKDALDAVLEGRPVPNPQTLAFGCVIRKPAAVAVAKGVPTYSGQVASILREKCENCHRPGEVAPFSLQTYRQASAWANDIKRYTQNGYMPPWRPAPGYGEFKEEAHFRLSDTEKTTLAHWADAGAPLGDAKQIPAPRKFTQGWQLGEPDLVVTPPKEYRLGPDGDDVYRHFVINPNFTEDRYVSAVEVRPGNRAIVHHVIAFIDGSGASDALEGKDHDGQPGYTSFGGPGFAPTGMLGGWAPGNDPRFLPDGIGVWVPKGARLVLQVHYHRNGKEEADRTRIGLHFCRTTINKLIGPKFVINPYFKIPPGAERHEVTAETQFNEDVHVFSVTPHMHLLGREMKLWATLPDGTEKPLVWIKDWDFNWQATYPLKEPLALPKGSKVHLTAYYDNSPKNPRHPNKSNPRAVTWGEQTTDEMCVAFLGITRDAEHLAIQPAPVAKRETASR